jgi:hypothetical protein
VEALPPPPKCKCVYVCVMVGRIMLTDAQERGRRERHFIVRHLEAQALRATTAGVSITARTRGATGTSNVRAVARRGKEQTDTQPCCSTHRPPRPQPAPVSP